jgi:hypothetical protein
MNSRHVVKYALPIIFTDAHIPETAITVIIEPPYTIDGILDYYSRVYGYDRAHLRAGNMTAVLDLSDIHE